MTLIRVALAGTLFFGVSCAVHDEGELGIDQDVQEIGMDEPMSYSSDELAKSSGSEAAIEEAEIDGHLDEEAFEDEAFEDEAWEDEDFEALAPSNHKTECTYCYNKYSCYRSTHPHERRAKEKAKRDCQKKHKYGCKFYGCKKSRY